MDIIMDIKGYLFMICKDIFFHARYCRVYPFISFISSNFFIDIQLFIHSYPSFYPLISIHILFYYPDLILIYPHLIQPFYPFVSCYFSRFILTFILLVIRSGSRLIRLVVACCLIGPSFAYPAQQQGKPLCFYFPAPRCGGSRLPLLVAPAPGPSPQRHRLPLLPLQAPLPGIGGGSSVDNILQQNTAPGIHCCGSVVQAAAHYPQGTGFDTCQVHF